MGMRKYLKWILGIGIITTVVIPFSLVLIGRSILHNSDIPQKEFLLKSNEKQTILAFFPHPDDEVTVAGTLMKMVDQGHSLILVCLTRGEAADTGGKFPEKNSQKSEHWKWNMLLKSLGLLI